jgi:hypothetical protein
MKNLWNFLENADLAQQRRERAAKLRDEAQRERELDAQQQKDDLDDQEQERKREEDKVVTPAKLRELSKRQIEDYTEEVVEPVKVDTSFLSPEDKKFYRKNKSHPDIQWALDMCHG